MWTLTPILLYSKSLLVSLSHSWVRRKDGRQHTVLSLKDLPSLLLSSNCFSFSHYNPSFLLSLSSLSFYPCLLLVFPSLSSLILCFLPSSFPTLPFFLLSFLPSFLASLFPPLLSLSSFLATSPLLASLLHCLLASFLHCFPPRALRSFLPSSFPYLFVCLLALIPLR